MNICQSVLGWPGLDKIKRKGTIVYKIIIYPKSGPKHQLSLQASCFRHSWFAKVSIKDLLDGHVVLQCTAAGHFLAAIYLCRTNLSEDSQ